MRLHPEGCTPLVLSDEVLTLATETRMNFIAKLVNSLGCDIGHIKCSTNAEGTETIKRDWLPLLEPGDSILIVSVVED